MKSMDVKEAIHANRAIRKFINTVLPEDIVITILNAGRRAQSSKNSQPWQFIAIQDKRILTELSKCGEWAGHLAEADLGVALLSPDPMEKFQIMFDLGQSAAYMQLTAWELGVGSCLASIYNHERARQILGFPPDLHLRIAISFGYPENASLLSVPLKKGGRKSFDEIVHWEKW
jgi:nitroreductase